MTTWPEVERGFRELEEALRDVRIDRQWGDSVPERWDLVGAPGPSRNRFLAMASIAGKLLASQPASLPAEITGEIDPTIRWYRALWHLGGPHEPPMFGTQSRDGVSLGCVYMGRIRSPAAVSAAVALTLQAEEFQPVPYVARTQGLADRLQHRLEVERQRRGTFWQVFAVIAGLVLAALALFG